jgi:hypothetical protein
LAFSPQENFTDWSTAAGQLISVSTFADRKLSHGQRVGSPHPLILVF